MTTNPTLAAGAAPGLYPGLSFANYWVLPAVNHSRLEPFKKTAAHAREEMLHPKDSTEALATGHAFHVFVLEPERFRREYVVPPKVDRRTKEGKAIWAAFEEEHPTQLAISQDEYGQFEAMRAAILSHPVAAELLQSAIARELSFVWQEESEGRAPILCKGRADLLSPYGGWVWIVDLKTTRDAGERSFSKDVASYGYHRGMGWYRRGLNILKPADPRRVAFIAVEKEPPYAVAVHELDERALEQGEREMLRYLDAYQSCLSSGVWPGYDPGMSLMDLPPWAVDRLD